MEAIEKLRKAANGHRGGSPYVRQELREQFGVDEMSDASITNAVADAIESELWGGYVALPVDRDGVPIHLGDEMETVGGQVVRVRHMTIYESGWLLNYSARTPSMMTHRPKTVEDVLRKFVTEFNRDDTELCDEEIIERFAAKLRLSEEERC